MPRIFINLEAGCLQVNLMSTSAQINQLKYTILYYTNLPIYAINNCIYVDPRYIRLKRSDKNMAETMKNLIY